MTHKLNEKGQVGAAIVFFLCVVLIPTTIFLLTPLLTGAQDLVATQPHVSAARIDTLNTLNTFWIAMPIALIIMCGLWYWTQSLRERDTVV